MKRIIGAIWLLLLTAIPALATVNIETTRVAYTCNGVITSYAYPFKVLADADLLVIKTATATSAETTLTLNTDYTVTGAGSSAGTVVLTAGSKCGTGYTLTILRNMAATQGTDYVDGEAFSAESIENALDKVTLIQQQQREEIGRAPKLPKTSTITDIALPNPTANNYIGWNAGATGLANLTGPVITTATQYEIDALISYGGGTSYTSATINAAITAIGSGTAEILIRPGAWAITAAVVFTDKIQPKMAAGAYFVISGAGSVTGLGNSRPEWWYSGSGSWHTAIQYAAAANADNGCTVEFGAKNYSITTGVLIKNFNVHLRGQGRTATTITFAPTSPDTAFTFATTGMTNMGEDQVPSVVGSAQPVIAYNSLKAMAITGGANTTVKTAVKLVGADQFVMEDVKIFNFLGTRSIGIHTKGHEFNFFRDILVYCDLPILMDVGPSMSGIAIDADHYNFHNLYLVATGSYPCIMQNAQGFMLNVSFTGVQSWVGGTYGFYRSTTNIGSTGFTSTGRSGTNGVLSISNVRTEQGSDINAYSIYVANMANVLIQSSYLDSARKGIYGRSIYSGGGLTLLNVSYLGNGTPPNATVALDVDTSVYPVTKLGCWFQAGSTQSVGDLKSKLGARFGTYQNFALEYLAPTYYQIAGGADQYSPFFDGIIISENIYEFYFRETLASGASSKAINITGAKEVSYEVQGFVPSTNKMVGGTVMDIIDVDTLPVLINGTTATASTEPLVVTDAAVSLCVLRAPANVNTTTIKNNLAASIDVTVKMRLSF